MLKEKIAKFKACIENKQFYEAHEVLEEIWFPIRKTKSELCLVLKGFINGAVSMELHNRDRKEQSLTIYKVYLKYVTSSRIEKTQFQKEFFELQSFMDKSFEKLLKSCP